MSVISINIKINFRVFQHLLAMVGAGRSPYKEAEKLLTIAIEKGYLEWEKQKQKDQEKEKK